MRLGMRIAAYASHVRARAWSEKQVLLVIPVCVCLEHTARARGGAWAVDNFRHRFLLVFCCLCQPRDDLATEKFAICRVGQPASKNNPLAQPEGLKSA